MAIADARSTWGIQVSQLNMSTVSSRQRSWSSHFHKGHKSREKSLKFTTGTIIEFKYALFDLAAHEDGFTQETYADLFNINCDIILRVTIYSGQNKKISRRSRA